MRAAVLNDYGSVDNLAISDAPEPTAGVGELLVAVEFAGLRYGDVMARYGIPAPFFTPPFVPGQELAGRVKALGEGVTGFAVGDRVMANVLGGAFAEVAVAAAAQTRLVPDGVRLDQALAYLVNMPVAYLLVNEWGEITDGDTVLLHAAAGGVGCLALQVIKRRIAGARVIALTGTNEKGEQCRANGADEVINYKTCDYVEEVLELTDGRGVDVSLNSVSGSTLESDPRAIRTLGRWVIYGFSGGIGNIDHSAFGYRGITIKPMSIVAYLDQPIMTEAIRFTDDWLGSESLIEPTRFRLDEIAEAQSLIEEGRNSGKYVIEL